MYYEIREQCVCCGACAADCPEGVITRCGDQYVIGPGCIACGDCYAICPVGAIIRIESEEKDTM